MEGDRAFLCPSFALIWFCSSEDGSIEEFGPKSRECEDIEEGMEESEALNIGGKGERECA